MRCLASHEVAASPLIAGCAFPSKRALLSLNKRDRQIPRGYNPSALRQAPTPIHQNERGKPLTAATAEFSAERSNAGRAIALGGVLAGILDISAAFVNGGLNGRSPMFVLQSVASGLLGRESYIGGLKTAALGAVVHFSIAFVACTVYYLVSRKINFLIRRPLVCGLVYGVGVYMFMYLVVLPLRFHRSFVQSLSVVATDVAIHMFCVGLPISLAIRRYSE